MEQSTQVDAVLSADTAAPWSAEDIITIGVGCRKSNNAAEKTTVLGMPPGTRYSLEMELIFDVRDADEGGYFARAIGRSIFTQAGTWDALRANALEAVMLHFEDGVAQPELVRFRYFEEELILTPNE